MKSFWRIALCIAILCLSLAAAFSQNKDKDEDKDRYVRLMSAQTVRLLEIDGKTFRKAEGPARFLHNNTWLICDTALWDVDQQIIHAIGHVSIEQENTELISDNLTYFAERDMAEFRGGLVQLRDKENNTLRTRNLDYNTKDSVAVFRYGGAMRDKDGQLIESVDGTYEAKLKLFTFTNDVNMFTDSIFIKTTKLLYDSKTSTATFPSTLDAWKEDQMMSSEAGWYDRSKEMFLFRKDVHLMSSTREGWCDSLFFDRAHRNLDMLGNAQLDDNQRHVSALSGRISYVDTLSRVQMFKDPVVMLQTTQEKDGIEKVDTLYMRADTISYWTVKRHKVDSMAVVEANGRLAELKIDPVANIRKKAAEEAAKRLAEALANDPNAPPQLKQADKQGEKNQDEEQADQDKPAEALDSSKLQAAADTLAKVEIDSTAMGFIRAIRNVKVFRSDMQAQCDSLLYSDLDSMARMYINPVIWNEGTHQYDADSIFIVVHNQTMERANLLSNAFIHVQEMEGLYYDQIRSAEMSAFFNDKTELERFDAMGGATALFYIKEKDRISTANRCESTILSANFDNGQIAKITYFESPKSDAFPIAQMSKSDMQIKGFNWSGNKRPKSAADLTSRVAKKTQREEYSLRPRAEFAQTEKYFKGYMAKIYRELERSDSLRKARQNYKDTAALIVDSLAVKDSLEVKDSIAVNDSLTAAIAGAALAVSAIDTAKLSDKIDSLNVSDSLNRSDSLHLSDSLNMADTLSPAQIKKAQKEAARAQLRKEREEKAAAKQAALEAKWAEMDARDAAKAEAKAEAKRAARHKKERKQMEKLSRLKAKEDAMLEKYKQKMMRKAKELST